MDIRSVLIEREDKTSSSVISSSAILIKRKYVLTTSNILSSVLQKNVELVQNISAGKLHLYKGRNNVKIRVIWKNDETQLVSEGAHIFGIFKCKHIEEFCKHEFRDWSIDFKENNFEFKSLLSVFLILSVENETANEDELKSLLYSWLLNTYSLNLNKGDAIICESTPFGTREFLNSLSEGVISNRLNKTFLLLSDCSSTPGCEGGLVKSKMDPVWPIGLIISSLNWWRKEWAGFTLISDIKPIICQILGLDLIYSNQNQITLNKVLDSSENSLAQINCGADWGTCILLCKEQKIFITNSHVIQRGLKIRIFWKNTTMPASLIYKTPDDSIFDLAIVKCNTDLSLMSSCNVTISTYNFGDAVYCAGFPLLSTLSKPEGVTVTRGIISDCNPYMIKTTCGVFPGFSGGAVLNSEGILLGIIVCNTRIMDIDVTYPKFNMAVPYGAVTDVITDYIQTEDDQILTKLQSSNYEAIRMWMRLEEKL